ncbi:MAG TPA: hypothetical protein VEV44_09120, partial [Pseudoneobacillus sp.]|nr:hypothetical protein [Pseudoneobacillus sp.]
NIIIDDNKLNKLMELRHKYSKKRNFKIKNNTMDSINYSIDCENETDKQIDEFYNEIRNEAYSICSNEKELANHLIHIDYCLFPNDSKDFAWNIGTDGILETLKSKSNMLIEMPFPSNNGVEYLGRKYKLQGVLI